MTDDPIADAKRALRERMRRARAGVSAEERERAARLMRPTFAKAVELPANAIVAGYLASGSELNATPLMTALEEQGVTLALPVVGERGHKLVFRAWKSGDALTPNRYDIGEPMDDKPEVTPTHLLVPLLAFDDHGYRLGYGGGYYDRTLAALRKASKIQAVGLAFHAQRLGFVPRGPGDEPLDMVLTERNVVVAGTGGKP
ncbi:MAG: 5-formyltetrahydrofolate cyclo-ligase [Rhodospirillales bacterium]